MDDFSLLWSKALRAPRGAFPRLAPLWERGLPRHKVRHSSPYGSLLLSVITGSTGRAGSARLTLQDMALLRIWALPATLAHEPPAGG